MGIKSSSASLGRPAKGGAAAYAVTALILGQCVALGANNALLGSLAACADLILALVLLQSSRPGPEFWWALRPVLVPMIAAAAWTSVPEIMLAADIVPATAALRARPVTGLYPTELAKFIGVIACLLIGALIASRPGLTRRTVEILVAGGAMWLLASFVMYELDPLHVWGLSKGLRADRFTATLLNPNAAGCIMAVLAALATASLLVRLRGTEAHGWSPAAMVRIVGQAVLICLILGAIILTRSRFDIAVALAAIGLLMGTGLLRGGRPTLLFGVLFILTVLFGGGLLIAIGSPIALKLLQLGPDAVVRAEAIRFYFTLSLQSPWFGFGLGSFRELNTAHLSPDNVADLWNFGAAHCAPIQAALEGGWPFAILLVIAVIGGAMRVAGSLRSAAFDPFDQAIMLGVAIILACSSVDIALNVPAVAALAAVLAGMALGTISRFRSGAVQPPPPDRGHEGRQ